MPARDEIRGEQSSITTGNLTTCKSLMSKDDYIEAINTLAMKFLKEREGNVQAKSLLIRNEL